MSSDSERNLISSSKPRPLGVAVNKEQSIRSDGTTARGETLGDRHDPRPVPHLTRRRGRQGGAMRNRLLATAIAIALGGALPIQAGASSAAAPRAAISMAFSSSRIDAGSAASFEYSTTGIAAGTPMFLQRQFGSGRTWKSVEKLKGTSGTAATPRMVLGRYVFRILSSGARRTASPGHTLFVYGRVSFEVVCHAVHGGCSGAPQTEEVGSTIFTYTGAFYSATYPSWAQALSASKSTCRSATLHFAQETDYDPNGYTSYLEVVQAGPNPQMNSTGPNTIGTLTVTLNGGPWIVSTADTEPNAIDTSAVFLNGHFSCYTTTGT